MEHFVSTLCIKLQIYNVINSPDTIMLTYIIIIIIIIIIITSLVSPFNYLIN